MLHITISSSSLVTKPGNILATSLRKNKHFKMLHITMRVHGSIATKLAPTLVTHYTYNHHHYNSIICVGYKLAFNYLKAKRLIEAIDICHVVRI